ncbi:MAG: helix-turn-helix domain-containing protein [Patescibacteria group bacterium]
MPTDPQGTLTRLGLTECESAMYLTMLACGAQSVQVLARESKISRTAAYEVLESLQKRGLVVKKTDGTKWTFLAEDPEKLEAYFSQRLTLFETELGTLKRMAPELRVLQGEQDTRPRVRFLSGYEGLTTLFEDVERVAPAEILEFMDADHMQTSVDKERVHKARKVVNYERTRVKFLYKGEAFIPKFSHVTHRKITESESFRGNFWIYANRVVFLNYQQNIEIVVIDHHVFAETMRVMFMLAWRCSTPIEVASA